MLRNNQNKIFSDIASLKTIPEGEVFDAENVWNKLENIINKKKKRKAVWIWIAASMLILISVSIFFKLYHYSKTNEQIVVKNKQTLPAKSADTSSSINANYLFNNTAKKANDNKKIVESNKIVAAIDTSNIATTTAEIAYIDSTPLLKEEHKVALNAPIKKTIKKHLKIVYASDFVDENYIAKLKPQEKISISKGLFKVFETPANKEPEENSALEHNQQQPNKTLLFFKAKPNTTISINTINENQ